MTEEITIGHSILGSIINNPSCQLLGLQKISSPQLFADEPSQHLYKAIQDMYVQSMEIDALTLKDFMKKNKYMKLVGEDNYSDIIRFSLNIPNFESRMALLYDNYVYRTLRGVNMEITAETEAKTMKPTMLIQRALEKIEGTLTVDKTAMVSTLGQNLNQLMREMSEDTPDPKTAPISCGYEEIDKIVKMSGGKLIIVGARPSMGKTAFACELARRMAMINGVPIGVMTMEMTALEYTKRLCAQQLRWNSYSFDNGFLHDAQKAKFATFKQQFTSSPIYLDDDASVDISSLPSRILYMHRKYGIKKFIIDHLGLVDLREDKYTSREQAVGKMTRGLKQLARKLNIDIIALYQLSREVERRTPPRPMLSDLKDSGSVEADADVVIFLYRPDYYVANAYEPKTKQEKDTYGHLTGKFITKIGDEIVELDGKCEVIIAKNRNGKIDRLYYSFTKEHQTFDFDKELTDKIKRNHG